MNKTKASKTSRDQAHTPKSPKGMGDYSGTAVKQKLGRIRDTFGPNYNPLPPSKLKVPPRGVV